MLPAAVPPRKHLFSHTPTGCVLLGIQHSMHRTKANQDFHCEESRMHEALPEEIRQATSSSTFSKVACQDEIVDVVAFCKLS